MIAVFLAALSLSSASPAARGSACPISIADFGPVVASVDGKAYIYLVEFSTASKDVAASHIIVSGEEEGRAFTVDVRQLNWDARHHAYSTFHWPDATLKTATVADASGQAVAPQACSANWIPVNPFQASPGLVVWADLSAPVTVDHPKAEPGSFEEAKIRHVAPPSVSMAHDQLAMASVFVRVGVTGKPLEAGLQESTGVRALDNSAVAAAMQSDFFPAKLNGRALILYYTMCYGFDIQNGRTQTIVSMDGRSSRVLPCRSSL